jgi:N-acetyl-anhydromuramyl-L-alanine amidase AmpD
MIYFAKPKKVEIFVNTAYLKLVDIKARTGCDLCFNGGLFDMTTFKPYVKLRVGGVTYVNDEYNYWGYGWNKGGFPTGLTHSEAIEDYGNYITCACLCKDGRPEPLAVGEGVDGARERTAWGIKPDGTHVFYVNKLPMAPIALQAYMIAQGCDSALMLDGGGSTQGIFPDGEVYSSRIVHNVICVWFPKEEAKPDDGDLKIIEPTYKWNGTFKKRKSTSLIVLHHAAASTASADKVHEWHLARGWTGIGYHYYVRKDGSVYRGRPEDTVGAHEPAANEISVAICFEGNFETDVMSSAQYGAGEKLIKDVLTRYPITAIKGHRDFAATACPGKNFPLGKFAASVRPTATVTLDVLRKGDKNKQVITLQKLLPDVQVDGDFGPKTETAVRKFQLAKNLATDGIVGEKTWNALLK